MSEIAIITDSLASIPQQLLGQYGIHVLPQILIWEGETLLDGVDITPTEFYHRLSSAKEMPTTSQVTVGAFKDIFEPLVERGTPILAILVSSQLSGTVQSAVTAKEMFPGATIEIVDSRSVSMAMGYQVLAAARAAAEGQSLEQVVAIAHQGSEHTGVLFAVDTLEFLHRGGRIGGASRLLGTALNLKPVLELRDGRVEATEKVRTKSKALARVLDLVEERIAGADNVRLAVLHANAQEGANAMLEAAVVRCHPVESIMTDVSPVLGTHAGPGTVGLAYCTGM
ncbi:MAG: DegV family protein [Anaerolineales bacterium]|jgi:DegV family protein with EDD domain